MSGSDATPAFEALQSTNEELETTNEELETLNDELRRRSAELNTVNSYLDSILGSVYVGVAVVGREGEVHL